MASYKIFLFGLFGSLAVSLIAMYLATNGLRIVIGAFIIFFIILYFLSVKKSRELTDVFNEMVYNLKELQEALEEAKTVSEIKIRARTKELQELAESLEDKVGERTQELRARIEELERFQALTIGRELKMIELKKELEKISKVKEDKSSFPSSL